MISSIHNRGIDGSNVLRLYAKPRALLGEFSALLLPSIDLGLSQVFG